MKKQEPFKHILINGISRSGGSLLARLFDGYPGFYSLPFEMNYSVNKSVWPLLENCDNPEEVFKEVYGSYFKKFLTKDILRDVSCEGSRKSFDYTGFKKNVIKILEKKKQFKLNDIIHLLIQQFFCHFSNGIYQIEKPNGVVNHLSMGFLLDVKKFYQYFPNGFIVQTIREPFSWYASLKKHNKFNDDCRLSLYSSFALWVESCYRAIGRSNLYFSKYIILDYQDLVSDTKKQMELMCSSFDVEWRDILLNPTIFLRDWMSNSSYKSKKEVNKDSLSQWRQYLTSSEINWIKEHTGQICSILFDNNNLTVPKYIECPLFGYQVKLNFTDDLGLCDEEFRRLSGLTLNNFQLNNQIRGSRSNLKEFIV